MRYVRFTVIEREGAGGGELDSFKALREFMRVRRGVSCVETFVFADWNATTHAISFCLGLV